ncbi:MAG: hypothetical protein ACRD1S_13285 [Vicinamibacterales bacterium]
MDLLDQPSKNRIGELEVLRSHGIDPLVGVVVHHGAAFWTDHPRRSLGHLKPPDF